MKPLKERDILRYLTKRVKELGGEVRRVKWIGRNSAPDVVVLRPHTMDDLEWEGVGAAITWVEVKNPETIETFPADARERAQHREHERMRKMGQCVKVIGTIEQVDKLFA